MRTASAILAAVVPSAEQLTNWSFFLGLLAGVFLALLATWWISEHGIDWSVARVNRKRSAPVIDFSERRRLAATIAIGEARR